MGAMPWNIAGPYDSDAEVALRLLQRQYFEQNYDLAKTIVQEIAAAQSCVDAVQHDDEYGLLDTYTSFLEEVQAIADEGIPVDIDSQIDRLRRLINARGEPLNNILDIKGVSNQLEEWHVTPLTDSQLNDFFQTSRPTADRVNDVALGPLYSMLGRAQAVSFPLFANPPSVSPSEIRYVGYTAD